MVYTIDKTKQSKWDATYEGPFTITQRNRGGTYTLKDKTGELLKRRFTIDMLKPVINSLRGGNDNSSKGPHYHVEKILDSKRIKGKQMYLVKWKGYTKRYNTWEPESNFDDVAVIRKYWKNKPELIRNKRD